MGCLISKDKVNIIYAYYDMQSKNICCIRINWNSGKDEILNDNHSVLILKLLSLTNYSTIFTPVYYIGINESYINIPYQKKNILAEEWIGLQDIILMYKK